MEIKCISAKALFEKKLLIPSLLLSPSSTKTSMKKSLSPLKPRITVETSSTQTQTPAFKNQPIPSPQLRNNPTINSPLSTQKKVSLASIGARSLNSMRSVQRSVSPSFTTPSQIRMIKEHLLSSSQNLPNKQSCSSSPDQQSPNISAQSPLSSTHKKPLFLTLQNNILIEEMEPRRIVCAATTVAAVAAGSPLNLLKKHHKKERTLKRTDSMEAKLQEILSETPSDPKQQQHQSLQEKVNERRKQIELYSKLKGIPYSISQEEVFEMFRSEYRLLRPQLSEEFFYFNQGASPYDLLLTSYENKNPRKFITISARGVLENHNGEERFITIHRFEQERRGYYALRNVEFFRRFWEWKSFASWKRVMRREAMARSRSQIEQKLFILNPAFRKPILKIRATCLELSKTAMINTFQMQNLNSVYISDFNKSQMKYLNADFKLKIEELQQRIAAIIHAACKAQLAHFTSTRCIDSIQEATYTQKALLAFEYKQLTSFVRLIDCIHMNSKSLLIFHGIASIAKMIDNMNTGREVGGKVKIFGSLTEYQESVSQSESELEIEPSQREERVNPSKEQSMEVLTEIITKSCEVSVSVHQFYFLDESLQMYMIPTINPNSNHAPNNPAHHSDNIDSISKQDIDELRSSMQINIFDSTEFILNYTHLKVIMNENYQRIQAKCRIIQTMREFIRKYQPIEPSALEKFEAAQFSEIFEMFQEDKKTVQDMEVMSDIGFFALDQSAIADRVKLQLKEFYAHSFEAIELKIDQMATAFSERIKGKSKDIFKIPENIDQFHSLLTAYQTLEPFIEADKSDMQRINDLKQVCASKKIILSAHLKQLLNSTTYQFEELMRVFNKTQANMDSIMYKYKMALEKEIKTFQAKSSIFIANNLSFLQVHRDLDDANTICQRLTEELHQDAESLEALSQSISLSQKQLDLDSKQLLGPSNPYQAHKGLLAKTTRFWEYVQQWKAEEASVYNVQVSKLDYQRIFKALETVEASTVILFQDYIDQHAHNIDIVTQFNGFLAEFEQRLKLLLEIKYLFVDNRVEMHLDAFYNIILAQQKKLFPSQPPLLKPFIEGELNYGFAIKYQLFDVSNDIILVKSTKQQIVQPKKTKTKQKNHHH